MSICLKGDGNATISCCAVEARGEEPYFLITISRDEMPSRSIKLRPDMAIGLGKCLADEAAGLMIFIEGVEED
jgi:hypothetical protein